MSNRQLSAQSNFTAATFTTSADRLRAHWKQTVKLAPPGQRWGWLKAQDAITALGAKQAATLRKQIERRAREVGGTSCSAAWGDEWTFAGQLQPGLRFEGDDQILQVDDGRRHSVRLVRSRGLVRNGESGGGPRDLPTAGPGTSRYTPPQAVEVEDLLDQLSATEAMYYSYPASPSAQAIRMIERRRGRERGKFDARDRIVELAQGDQDPRIETFGRQLPRQV